MDRLLKEARSYFKAILKRWVLLLIFYGTLLSSPFAFPLLKIHIPGTLLWILAFIGLLWVNFQVYIEQQKKIPHEEEDPKISIELVEGNEYTYRLSDKPAWNRDPAIFLGEVKLHLKFMNRSSQEVEILNININYAIHPVWFIRTTIHLVYSEQQDIVFPKRFPGNAILICDAINEITPSPSLNEAQFADRLREHKEKDIKIEVGLGLELRNLHGKRFYFNEKKHISPSQLEDLYISRWQELGKEELLRLVH